MVPTWFKVICGAFVGGLSALFAGCIDPTFGRTYWAIFGFGFVMNFLGFMEGGVRGYSLIQRRDA